MAESRNRSFAKLAKDIDTSGNIVAAGISSSVSLGATVYATRANLPSSGNTAGDQAYVTDNNRLYIWTGSGWYNVALVNRAPAISSVTDSDGGTTPFSLSAQGLDTVITITAADSDGDPITYTATTDSNFAGLGTISQSDNVFTITPLGQDSATVTSATITFKADDGINISSSINTFTLNFLSPLWNETVLSIGTNSTNSLDNSTVIDKSSNTATITTSGSVTQSAFHPYLNNWGVDFDGNGDGINLSARSDWDMQADQTLECWIYTNNSIAASGTPIATMGTGGSALVWSWQATNNEVYFREGSGSWGWGSAAFVSSLSNWIEGGWNHVFVQRSSNNLYIGINGQIENMGTAPSFPNATGTLHIASYFNDYNSSGAWHNGSISNFRISNVARYGTGPSYTVPTENLQSDSDTALLICQSYTFSDNSSNQYTLTQQGNARISSFNPFGQDSEYLSNQGLGSGFSAQGSYTQWTGTESSYTGDFTYSFWMYVTSYTTGYDAVLSDPAVQNAACDWTMNDLGYGYRLGLNTLTNGAYTDVYHLPLTKANLYGRWTHITTSRKSGLIRVYVNGVQTNLARQTSNTYNYSTISNSSGINLSQHQVGIFAGYIADYKIVLGTGYDTATIDLPTSYSYDANSYRHITWDNAGIYDKTGNQALTVYGNSLTSTTQTKYTTTSMYFDGNGDYIRSVQNNSLILSPDEDFTIEGWVWLSSLSNTMEMFCQFAPPHHSIAISLNRGGYGNTWVLLGNGSSWNGVPAIDTGGTAPLGAQQWHHVALVKNGSTITIYHDANQAGQTTTSFATTTGNLILGAYELNGSFGEYLSGYIEGFQVLKGVAKYTSPGFTLPTQPQGRTYQAES